MVDERRAADEEHEPGEHVRRPSGGDVEHRQEDPELEQRASEVVRLDEHEHRRAPDQEQRPEVLEPPLRQHLALVAQIAGEEDDQEDLRQLARLELERAHLHPQPRAVDRLADPRQRRQHQQQDRRDPEQVLVLLEDPVVAAEREERQREEDDADHDPEALPEGVVRVQPVDQRHADRRQQRRERQQHRVGVRRGVADDEVRGQVERHEDARVGERAGVELRRLRPGDVDARKADRREQAHGDQVQQLTVSQRLSGSAPRLRAPTSATSSTISSTSGRIRRRGSGRPCGDATSTCCRCSSTTAAGITAVSTAGTASSGESVSSSSSGAATAGSCAVSPSSAPASSLAIWKRTTVMLSSPPPSFAA